jgi:hypothetical protein
LIDDPGPGQGGAVQSATDGVQKVLLEFVNEISIQRIKSDTGCKTGQSPRGVLRHSPNLPVFFAFLNSGQRIALQREILRSALRSLFDL